MGDYVHATAVAVPVGSFKMDHNGMEENVYSNDALNNMDDTIERSGELFSQLDHMIAAVQVESNALDSMREKLKELDTLRSQLSILTK